MLRTAPSTRYRGVAPRRRRLEGAIAAFRKGLENHAGRHACASVANALWRGDEQRVGSGGAALGIP